MKLLVVSQYFWPENFRINDLVSSLIQRGHEVTVLTGLPNYPKGRFATGYGMHGPWSEAHRGARLYRVPLIPRGNGRAIQLILNYASYALAASWAVFFRLPKDAHFDAIFVFQISPATVGVPAIAARWKYRAPILFWILDLWPESLQATGAVKSPRILSAVARGVRWIYDHCEQILVQSRAFETNLQNMVKKKSHIRYFPNWIETEYLAAISSATEARKPNEFRIVYAGNIGAAQDFPSIIAAASEIAICVPQAKWIIAGDGRMADWVKSEVARLNLTSRFEFLGHLPATAMPTLFANADTLLVSLRAEPVFALTIPGKVQSYLASGRPVLAMLNGESRRVIEESGGGWSVAAGDHHGLTKLVAQLASLSPEARSEMGRKGQEYALREFNRDALFDRLELWLEEAVRTNKLKVNNANAI